jgi:hypothetical protein
MKGQALSSSQSGTLSLDNEFVVFVEQLNMLVINKCATTRCGYEQGLHHLCLHLVNVGYKK